MKLTIETIRQIIKEELTNLLQESPQVHQVFTLLDGSWDQGMLVADVLSGQDRSTFMQLAAGYVVDKLKELAEKINIYLRKRFDAHDFEFKDITSGNPKYQIEFKLRYYNSNTKFEFNKSYVRLRKEDGMFDLDLHINPEAGPKEYEEDYPKRYKQDGLGLDEVIDILITVYTQGGTI